MPTLSETLLEKDVPQKEVDKFTAYVNQATREEEGKEDKKRPVSINEPSDLARLYFKYWDLGVPLDGNNAVIAGKNKVFVTYHGYKNKILKTYPESKIDMQLVREGDEFEVEKDSGEINYNHKINNVFDNKPIIGAYVIIKNSRGNFLELLNKNDFEEMKKSSKMSWLWNTWGSEFWLKSVIKRACKRHFNDITADIDKIDNEDFGLADSEAEKNEGKPLDVDVEETIQKLQTAKTADELRDIYFDSKHTNIPEVIEAKNSMKEKLQKKAERAAKKEAAV